MALGLRQTRHERLFAASVNQLARVMSFAPWRKAIAFAYRNSDNFARRLWWQSCWHCLFLLPHRLPRSSFGRRSLMTANAPVPMLAIRCRGCPAQLKHQFRQWCQFLPPFSGHAFDPHADSHNSPAFAKKAWQTAAEYQRPLATISSSKGLTWEIWPFSLALSSSDNVLMAVKPALLANR